MSWFETLINKLGAPQVYAPSIVAISVLFAIGYYVGGLTRHILGLVILPFDLLFIVAMILCMVERLFLSRSLSFGLAAFPYKPDNPYDKSDSSNGQQDNANPFSDPNQNQNSNTYKKRDANNKPYKVAKALLLALSTLFSYAIAPYVNICLRLYRLLNRCQPKGHDTYWQNILSG